MSGNVEKTYDPEDSLQFGHRLIEAFKDHPCLYKKSSLSFQIKEATTNAWDTIGKLCKKPDYECRIRFYCMLNNFIVQDIVYKSGKNQTKIRRNADIISKTFEHYNKMLFLKKYLDPERLEKKKDEIYRRSGITPIDLTKSQEELYRELDPVIIDESIFDFNAPDHEESSIEPHTRHHSNTLAKNLVKNPFAATQRGRFLERFLPTDQPPKTESRKRPVVALKKTSLDRSSPAFRALKKWCDPDPNRKALPCDIQGFFDKVSDRIRQVGITKEEFQTLQDKIVDVLATKLPTYNKS
ncbi:hypothetical protein DMENIID0001_063610 [Sergentomyia squamirostris]